MSLKANIQATGASYGHSNAVCGDLAPYVVAAGSTQATATLLARYARHIVTSGSGGVVIPPGIGHGDSLQEGDEIEITNAGLVDINIYPPLGSAFLGSLTNAAIILSPQYSVSVVVDSATRLIARYYQVNSGTAGAGTVTSVGLSLPSSILTVSGSPVISAGTLTGTLANQSANLVWAGPGTGSPAQPTFRSLVAADIPALTSSTSILYGNGTGGFSNVTIGSNLTFIAGTLSATGSGSGSVTSVGLSAPAIFSVSGSPVTTNGTLTFSLANQNANLIWAGPSTGSPAAPTFRSMVAADIPTNQKTAAIVFIIDGNGSAITTGVKGDLQIPFDCTITANTLLADQSGSIVVNIWKDTYANYPPTVADKITASAPPTISSADHSTDSTLTGWTTSITAGDTLRFNVDSATTITRVSILLKVVKS